ncbi:uncharacterized protein [Primulina eburnea]|uniref:uncharacterized protein n=1 Tax=Primulina eburnea TaxID=1245227 RepID=UPI003C6C2226
MERQLNDQEEERREDRHVEIPRRIPMLEYSNLLWREAGWLEHGWHSYASARDILLQNQDASIKGLENQIGQLAKMIASRESGTLSSNTETNPKEQVKAIALRNGKVLEQDEKEKEDQGKKAVGMHKALKKAKLDEQFGKFLEVFKKLHISIPFADALMQMPSYAKFLKDILANKRNLEDHMKVKLTENCSALVQNQIPPKLKDPGTLCDLGASINLMPLSVFKKLGLGEPKPTQMSMQLADGSVKHPRGVKEDVLVKVGTFTFPTDFVVLDMEEDREIPLILGRPFLATGKAVIEVQEGKLRLRVEKEGITFNVFKALKHPRHTNDCFMVDSSNSLVCQFVQDAMKDPLETKLTTAMKEDELDEEKYTRMAYCNANHQWKPEGMKLEDMGDQRDLTPQKSSIEKPLTRELKPRPPHLKYVYLELTKLAPDKLI